MLFLRRPSNWEANEQKEELWACARCAHTGRRGNYQCFSLMWNLAETLFTYRGQIIDTWFCILLLDCTKCAALREQMRILAAPASVSFLSTAPIMTSDTNPLDWDYSSSRAAAGKPEAVGRASLVCLPVTLATCLLSVPHTSSMTSSVRSGGCINGGCVFLHPFCASTVSLCLRRGCFLNVPVPVV